jgi:hypothetical protein
LKLVKASSVIFYRNYKIWKTNYIPAEQALAGFTKKLDLDVDTIGPSSYEINEEITNLTNMIVKSDVEINNGIAYIDRKQKLISRFLIDFNKQLNIRENTLLLNTSGFINN